MAVETLVDPNGLLDVLTEDPVWPVWSASAFTDAAEAGPLWINPIIYAEVSVRFSRIEDIEAALPSDDYRRAQLPWEEVFLAGKASSASGAAAAPAPPPSRTSTSARTPRWPTSRC